MSTAAGWYHAEGDPPNQIRYWNGTAWTGEPVAAPTTGTGAAISNGAAAAQAARGADLFTRLISPMGRVNRSTYAALFMCVVCFWFALVALLVVSVVTETPVLLYVLLVALLYVLPFALTWLFIATTSKRLHDMGTSAWWLLAVLVPPGGPLLTIFCLVSPGNAGPNVHGSDPGPGFHL